MLLWHYLDNNTQLCSITHLHTIRHAYTHHLNGNAVIMQQAEGMLQSPWKVLPAVHSPRVPDVFVLPSPPGPTQTSTCKKSSNGVITGDLCVHIHLYMSVQPILYSCPHIHTSSHAHQPPTSPPTPFTSPPLPSSLLPSPCLLSPSLPFPSPSLQGQVNASLALCAAGPDGPSSTPA